MTHSNNITKKAFYKKFNNWIGSSFECSDAEGLLNEVWSWISQALKEAKEEGRQELLKEQQVDKEKAIDNFAKDLKRMSVLK
jgi:hypothetical protein